MEKKTTTISDLYKINRELQDLWQKVDHIQTIVRRRGEGCRTSPEISESNEVFLEEIKRRLFVLKEHFNKDIIGDPRDP